jgi:hypothetical protein
MLSFSPYNRRDKQQHVGSMGIICIPACGASMLRLIAIKLFTIRGVRSAGIEVVPRDYLKVFLLPKR